MEAVPKTQYQKADSSTAVIRGSKSKIKTTSDEETARISKFAQEKFNKPRDVCMSSTDSDSSPDIKSRVKSNLRVRPRYQYYKRYTIRGATPRKVKGKPKLKRHHHHRHNRSQLIPNQPNIVSAPVIASNSGLLRPPILQATNVTSSTSVEQQNHYSNLFNQQPSSSTTHWHNTTKRIGSIIQTQSSASSSSAITPSSLRSHTPKPNSGAVKQPKRVMKRDPKQKAKKIVKPKKGGMKANSLKQNDPNTKFMNFSIDFILKSSNE